MSPQAIGHRVHASTLRDFTLVAYHTYQARENYLRQQRTIQWELEEERREKMQALKEKDAAMQRESQAMQRESQAMQRESQALAEIERLKVLLNRDASIVLP